MVTLAAPEAELPQGRGTGCQIALQTVPHTCPGKAFLTPSQPRLSDGYGVCFEAVEHQPVS